VQQQNPLSVFRLGGAAKPHPARGTFAWLDLACRLTLSAGGQMGSSAMLVNRSGACVMLARMSSGMRIWLSRFVLPVLHGGADVVVELMTNP
jgi:hypothetical protein